VSFFGHYVVAANWLLLQAFLSATNPITSTLPMGYCKKVPLCWYSNNSSLWYVILTNFFCFCIGLQTHQRSKQFFSVVIKIYFKETSLDAAARYVPKWNQVSNNLISVLDFHALYLKHLTS
jgi:hypothetical protein